MPPVIVAVGASVASAALGAAVVGTTLSLGTVLFNAAIAVAGQLVTGRLAAVGAGRRAAPALGVQARERTEMVRTAIGVRRVIYGEAMSSGPLLFAASTGAAKEYLHLVVPLAAHEVAAIDDLYFNDQLSTDARFAGFQRVNRRLGAAGQVADSDLVAEVPEWTSAHRLQGVAYAYVRLQWSAETWPTGLPNVKAVVRGRKILDPRDGGTRWSCNPALCVRDYLTADFGLGAAAAEIDDASFIAAANICDEMVALTEAAVVVTADAPNDALDLAAAARLERGDKVWVASTGALPSGVSAGADYFVIPASPAAQRTRVKLASTYANALAGIAIDIGSAGSGTHTLTRKAQGRYVCGGVVDLDLKPIDIMEQLLSACGGVLIYQQGRYRLFAGAATAATATLSERDLRAPLKLRPRPPRRELANAVRGSFVDPAQAWQPTEFAPVTKAAYESEDGGQRIFRDVELPFTAEATRAQRLAKLHLEKSRQGMVVEFPAKLTALRLAVWDVVQLSLARLGWINKEFRVVEWRLSEDGGVDLVLQEEAAAAYAWSATDALIGDPAPNTQLPSPFLVAPPTAVTLASGTAQLYLRRDGTVFSRIRVSWSAPADAFVASGGRIEVQHKKSADAAWQPSEFAAGDATSAYILDVQDGAAYDVRLRAVNAIGASSAWVTVANHVVAGKTAPPSDATGFTAAPNGALVVFRWQAVADLDIAGYSIRYGLAGAPWSAMTELTQATRGTQITTAAVPPGNWLFAIKARDTSGNESATAATSTLAVGNFNTVIALAQQAPDWLGTKVDFVKHWTGVLIPESTTAANQMTNAELFEQFVPYPKALCTYEAPEIDAGFDSSFRVFATSAAALGRGVVAGSPSPSLEIDYRLEAGSYDGFEPWTIGTVAARRVKTKLKLQPALGNAYVSGFTPTADAPVRDDERGQGVAVGSGGTAIVFARRFFFPPNVQVTPLGSSALIGVADSVTATGFTARLFDAAGAGAAGSINWQALGS